MRSQYLRLAVFAVAVSFAGAARAQAPSASTQGPVRITLDEAIQMALEHNHNLKAARTTIQQSEATEITANLRPNPILTAVSPHFPARQIQRGLHQHDGTVRSRRQLSL
jgi:outer membrane protein, heavy metal efflux system